MQDLPYVVVREILDYLSVDEVIKLSQVNRNFRNICLEFLTKHDRNPDLDYILKKMRKHNFYDYYILNNRNNHNIDIFCNIYELSVMFNAI